MRKRIFLIFYLALSAFVFGYVLKFCFASNIFFDLSFLDSMESTMENMFPGKSRLREIYGLSSLVLSPNEIASNGGATVKDEDGFLMPISYVSFDIEQAGNKIYELNTVCQNNGTEFVYISYPSKTNSKTTSESYGIETNEEQVRTNFLDWMSVHDINVLNVRELLEKDGYDVKDLFYKTDHHWKTTAGLYAARAISNYLNEKFGYEIQSNMLDEDNFSYTCYEDLWLGEIGRKLSKTWVGSLDDFIEIKPNFKTSLTIGAYSSEDKTEGDFSLLVDESGYAGTADLYSYSAHYSYKGSGSLTTIHNNNIEGKKILIIKDSFSIVVIPFLSLVNSDIVVWDMRETTEGLYDFIRDNDFDVVLLAYTDFWRSDIYSFN